MSITAKSVIIDYANNWGYSGYISFRSMDFWLDGSKIDIGYGDITAYATSYLGSTYGPNLPFVTTTSKTGSDYGAEFVSSLPASGRIICVFDSEIEFDEIRINNGHTSGGNTSRGIQNVAINTSSDTITDTTYAAAISNSEKIYDDTFDEHTSSDIEDEQILTLILPPVFVGLGGAIAGGSAGVHIPSYIAPISGGAISGGSATVESQEVSIGNLVQPLASISGEASSTIVSYGIYKPRVPSISGKALTTTIMTGQFYQPMASISGFCPSDSIGNFNAPRVSINAEALTTAIANGNIVAGKPEVKGTAVTTSLIHGVISVKPPVISAEMSSASLCTGNIKPKAPSISATAFTTSTLIGDFNVKHAEIRGVATTNIIAYGNYNAPLARIQSICDNPKKVTIIKYHRDRCAYV